MNTISPQQTPIYKQYQTFKAQHPKAVVLFRLGDFYEMFGTDAETASKVAGLVLTSRNISKSERVSMAGFPYHANEKYIAKLSEAGYSVVVVEQIGNEPINGLMPREIKRVIEPNPCKRPRVSKEAAASMEQAIASTSGYTHIDQDYVAVVERGETSSWVCNECGGDPWMVNNNNLKPRKAQPAPETPAETASESAPFTQAVTGLSAQVKLNKANVWVFFDRAPHREILAELKAAGMHWSQARKGWYISTGTFETTKQTATTDITSDETGPKWVIEASPAVMVVGPGTPTAHTYPETKQKPAKVVACEPKKAETVNTGRMVAALTENEQDFEWYPTTSAMIAAVASHCAMDTHSILDIGAGDGRVLKALSEKCKDAKLYGIEKSQILIQAQPDSIVPIGTDLFEQNLSCLKTDVIFCNPPYSEYEEWACKVISEGYAVKAFLVIPQRWNESKPIAAALERRGATARVIHSDDFRHAERQARAVVDVVEITYPKTGYRNESVKDPFDIWFDQNIDTFQRAEEFKESETGADLKKQYANSSIDEMVAAYREEYQLMEDNYRAIFRLDYAILHELGINKDHVRDGLKKKMSDLKIKYWQILFNRLDAITSRLSTKSRESLLKKLTDNTSVEFTAPNAYAVVLWAVKNARQYFDDQLIELFKALATFENAMKYKSNIKTWGQDDWRYASRYEERPRPTHYALDYRIVVEKWHAIYKAEEYRSYDYPGGLNKTCHELIADVVAVLSNLGFSTYSLKSMDRSWDGGKWQDWYNSDEEILFQVKAYMNGNVHLRFKPAAIMALNIEAGRLLKWVRSADEVVSEMGYTQEDAEQYFNSNAYMLASTVKLLGFGEVQS